MFPILAYGLSEELSNEVGFAFSKKRFEIKRSMIRREKI